MLPVPRNKEELAADKGSVVTHGATSINPIQSATIRVTDASMFACRQEPIGSELCPTSTIYSDARPSLCEVARIKLFGTIEVIMKTLSP